MISVYSTAFLGPISYFADMLRNKKVLIDGTEKWQKQSYRNRCYIDSPGGVLSLNIPIAHHSNKGKMAEVEISYVENWHIKHWQALKTSYGSSPFFEVLGPEIKEILYRKEIRLINLNTLLMEYCFYYLDVNVDFEVISDKNKFPKEFNDKRQSFHPKKKENLNFNVYPQVFDNMKSFVPDLSIADLLFNEGPAAYDYLNMH